MDESFYDEAENEFDRLRLSRLPPSMQRRSDKHYYLSIWPSLSAMSELGEDSDLPLYPDKINNVYIHVPFCSGACTFCNYYFNIIDEKSKTEAIASYVDTVSEEMLLHSRNSSLDCKYVYFGGGTPSILPSEWLDRLLNHASKKLQFSPNILGTIELHPELFSDYSKASEFLDICSGYGIKRVSIGLQDTNDRVLDVTNRRHGTDWVIPAIELIRTKNMIFNIDLMYGIPGQTVDGWERTLRSVLNQKPDSVSIYYLFLNGKTKLGLEVYKGSIRLPSYRRLQVLRLIALLHLEQAGYTELPGDFFTRSPPTPLAERGTYLSSDSHTLPVGPGSYGYFDRTQFANYFSIRDWQKSISHGLRAIWRGHRLSSSEALQRDIMFQLKNSLGICTRRLQEKWGAMPAEILDKINYLLRLDLFSEDEYGYNLTKKGRLCVEEISCAFAPPNPVPGKDRSSRNALAHDFSPTYNPLIENRS